MSKFIIAVEAKGNEKTEKEFSSESEALNFLFPTVEGKKFSYCPLAKLDKNKQTFNETFNKEIEKLVSTPPNSEGKYGNFIYEGHKYGAFYNDQYEQFTIWRMPWSTMGGSGSGSGFARKPAVIYNLLELYEAPIDEANQILRLERNQGEYINLVETKQIDSKLIYILKKEKAIILGQQGQQQQQDQQKKEDTTTKE
jgi:hypothetical protein